MLVNPHDAGASDSIRGDADFEKDRRLAVIPGRKDHLARFVPATEDWVVRSSDTKEVQIIGGTGSNPRERERR